MSNKNGIALLVVLVTLLIVVALANVVLNITLSQSRLTRHKVSRIQAYYATTGGVNYALDKLRRADDPINWPEPTAANPVYWHYMCLNTAPQCNPLFHPDPIIDNRLPFTIQYVIVRVAFRGAPVGIPADGAPWQACNPPAGVGVDICVNAKAFYAYQ